ncbi:glutaredoxin [Xylanimonas oleitrophica]|uniref:Glutaredoxin n=2 Tax=Xylanimonas oleitrophica TaxID=2607479 RepID=A0A2W5XQA4_9MICO|nr:glutaredoxin [Xylanimonas oleitrophica]
MVRTPACHFCHEAEETLGALFRARTINLVVVDADSDDGRDLIARHRPALAPLVLLDGEFFSSGRLPKHKLARALGAARLTVARP